MSKYGKCRQSGLQSAGCGPPYINMPVPLRDAAGSDTCAFGMSDFQSTWGHYRAVGTSSKGRGANTECADVCGSNEGCCLGWVGVGDLYRVFHRLVDATVCGDKYAIEVGLAIRARALHPPGEHCAEHPKRICAALLTAHRCCGVGSPRSSVLTTGKCHRQHRSDGHPSQGPRGTCRWYHRRCEANMINKGKMVHGSSFTSRADFCLIR